MRKLTHQEILSRQKELARQPRIPVTVVLNNIRSLYNVGSIFRSADGAGIEKIWLCGITGYPPDSRIAKTALGAYEHVPWEYASDACAVIDGLKKDGYTIVLLEQMDNSLAYDAFKPDGPVCLVLGNEIEGVADPVVARCDTAIEIPMTGIKNSLNVSVAFGVAAYRLRSCFMKTWIVDGSHA